jgi:putative intracellular protease/amidase
MRTAFAATEAVFICTEDGFEEEHLVVPAAAAVAAGYPHDLVQTELGEVEPVKPPE